MARSSRITLFVHAALATAALAPHSVFAQAAEKATNAAPAAANQDVAEGSGIEEVFVTARRRTERLSDVPLTINVKSRESLEAANIVSMKEITQVAPGLNYTLIGGAAQPTMRGISSQSTAAGAENNISIYVDGIYQSNVYAGSFDLPDVERVEVLKGPQGTTFGRNATGGAILIHTRNPEFTPGGTFEVSDGIFAGGANDARAKAFITAPLSDTLAFSFSGQYAKNEGYLDDVLRDERAGEIESKGARGKLLFKPSEDVSLLLNAYYSKRDDYSVFALQNVNSPFPNTPTKPYDVANDTKGFVKTETYGVSLRGDFETSVGTITSLTGYGRVSPIAVADADGSPTAAIIYDLEQPGTTLSQELTFASRNFGPTSFVAGALAYRGVEDFTPLAVRGEVGGPAFYEIYSRSIAEAYAAFIEATYQVTPQLSLVGGARYSTEERTYEGSMTYADADSLPKIASDSFDAVTPRFSARYAFTDDTNVYVTYSTGFKSGLYDTSSPSDQVVDPEKLKSYEVGIKTLLTDSLEMNAALFYYDVKDLQTSTNNAAGLAVLANAGSARVKGAELEATWQSTPEFRLAVSAAYIPTVKYVEYAGAAFVMPVPGGGGVDTTADLSGTRLAKTPEWQANLLANYETDLSWGKVGASANVSYSSSFFYELSRFLTQESYTLLNGQVSWAPPDSSFKVTLWGKNLTDKTTINNYLVNATGFNVVYQAPREVGLSLSYDF